MRLIRKPSLKKSFKARTTAKYKRRVKRAIVPGYGKKGTGFIKNPKRAMYNKVYNKVTIDPLKSTRHRSTQRNNTQSSKDTTSSSGCATALFCLIVGAFFGIPGIIIGLILGILVIWILNKK